MFLLAAVEQRRAKDDFVLTGVLWLPFGWCFYLTSGEQTWLYKVPTFGSFSLQGDFYVRFGDSICMYL